MLLEEISQNGRVFRKISADRNATKMPIGEHKIISIPKLIAGFLKLPGGPEYSEYKSHSFCHSHGRDHLIRRWSLNLQRAGGWHSQAVAQSYVESTTSSATSTSKRMMREEDRDNHLPTL